MGAESIEGLATPFLYVDLDRMNSNIDAMAAAARGFGVRLRPHAKTHKVPEIARLQIAAGAAGITLAKVSEAEVFADAGIDDVFIAYQVVAPAQFERLVRLGRRVKLRRAADGREGRNRCRAPRMMPESNYRCCSKSTSGSGGPGRARVGPRASSRTASRSFRT
jgi:D-serine deaminase-like pyridoxal phosphate-dependent protein